MESDPLAACLSQHSACKMPRLREIILAEPRRRCVEREASGPACAERGQLARLEGGLTLLVVCRDAFLGILALEA
jgi:hypothetical protein